MKRYIALHISCTAILSVALQTFGARKHICCTAMFVSCSAISCFLHCKLYFLQYNIIISCTSDSTFCCAAGGFCIS